MPSKARGRSVASVLRAAAFITLAGGASACSDDTPAPKAPTAAIDPAEEAKIAQSKALVKQASDALTDKKYDRARELLAKASELGVESQRFAIDEVREKVDKRLAKLWANEFDERFKSKDCAGAFKGLAEPLRTLADSEAFVRELHRLVGTDAQQCVQESVDQKLVGGAYADARKTVASREVNAVLGAAAAKKVSAELEATIFEALRAPVDAELKAKHFAQAAEKIEAAAKKGDATEEQVDALVAIVRERAAPEIGALAERALGQRDAAVALKQIDELVRLARWTAADPAAPVVQTGSALPEDLAKKRDTLAIWVETQRLSMHVQAKPEVRWTHGKTPIAPPASAEATPSRDLAHGTQVWVVGVAGNRALVTTSAPGAAKLTPFTMGPQAAPNPARAELAQVLRDAAGWAPITRLVRENSADWLVPDAELKGERVWGPLRQPDGLWELGVVSDVNGKDITVQRIADGVPVKLTRAKLRSGRLAPGTRVLTFCLAKDQPAQVVEIPKTARTAKLKCDGGQEKEEDLASLRSKPEILPVTKF